MADEDFNIIGPKHLTVVDWGNNDHKRSVVASLVRGVYVLERDRQVKRDGPNAFGPTWWLFFHFELVRELVDDDNKTTIFGAIFKYKPNKSSTHGFPNYIVAFKGTLIKKRSAIRDLYHDYKLSVNRLHRTSRAKTAFKVVKETLASTKNGNLWLAGHSLGASMALVVGRHMAGLSDESSNLESFLFNPPYVSPPVERLIKSEKVKHGLRIGKSIFKAGLEVALKKRVASSSSSESAALAKWAPNLFVHPSDVICAEYIGYFASRRKMVEWWMGGVAKLASQHSVGGLMLSAVGREAEPAAYLIHSARLIVNKNPEPHLVRAHSLDQWWSLDLQLDTNDYLYELLEHTPNGGEISGC